MPLTRVLVVVVALGALVACQDEPTPEIPDPTPTATSTAPSPSESESSPTPSPTAAALTPEETVRAWVAARNQALQDGDTTELRALSAKNCEGCEEHIQPIEDVFAAGGSFDTPGWTVDSSQASSASSSAIEVQAAVTMAGGTTVPAAGDEPVRYDEDKRIMVFRVTGEGSASQVSFVGYVS